MPPITTMTYQGNPVTIYPPEDTKLKWFFLHYTHTKALCVFLSIIGIAGIGTLPATLTYLGLAGAVSLASVGGVVALTSLIALGILAFLSGKHSMKTHVFKPFESDLLKLSYENHVPVLEIEYGKGNEEDYQKAGYEQGYHLGGYIQILKRWMKMDLKRRYGDLNNYSDFLNDLKKHIPENYLSELQGLINGYNHWAKEQWFPVTPLTENEAIFLHLLSDSMYLAPYKNSPAQQQDLSENLNPPKEDFSGVACTSIAARDKDGNIILARHLDWLLLGLGSYAIEVKRKYNGKIVTTEEGFPGLISTITGQNPDFGLSMNVTPGKMHKSLGTPSSFFNRYCLENYHSIEDFEKDLKEGTISPLGPYHLMIAEKTTAKSFHMYQGFISVDGTPHLIRSIDDEENQGMLWNTNCRVEAEAYDFSTLDGETDIHSLPRRLIKTNHMFWSPEREKMISDLDKAFLEYSQNNPDTSMESFLEQVMQLPYVNNQITVQSTFMYPGQNRKKTVFDNAYAASSPHRELPNLFHSDEAEGSSANKEDDTNEVVQ